MQAILIGTATALCAWALGGAISLTGITAFHATSRAALMRGLEDARASRTERLKQKGT